MQKLLLMQHFTMNITQNTSMCTPCTILFYAIAIYKTFCLKKIYILHHIKIYPEEWVISYKSL